MKTIHEGVCLYTLENLKKDCPGGSYIFMKSTPRVPCGRPLMDIGYKYNSRKVLGFIAIEGDGIIKPGDPYLSCFLDIYANFSVRPVVFPHLLGMYFKACNAIDSHNRIRHSVLALYK